MQKERLFEARIQNLTEDNDALRKDNDLLRRENDLNNGWIDNQQGLMKALEEAGEVQADQEARIEKLQKALEAQAEEKNAANTQKQNAPQQQLPPRMSFKQTNVNALFNIRDMTELQDHEEANSQ